MKTRFLILILCFCVTLSYAQTRLIAHRSHSGSNASFSHILSTSLDVKDFGEAPTRIVRTAVLDSLIYVSDTMMIMVTSNYCKEVSRYRSPKINEDSISMTERMKGAYLWEAGRDTLHSHALFSKNHDLDSIKKTLDEEYYFNNSSNTVVFVGYDNIKTKKYNKNKKHEVVPVSIPEQPRTPADMRPLMGIALLMLCSLLIGLVSWKLYQVKLLVQK